MHLPSVMSHIPLPVSVVALLTSLHLMCSPMRRGGVTLSCSVTLQHQIHQHSKSPELFLSGAGPGAAELGWLQGQSGR